MNRAIQKSIDDDKENNITTIRLFIRGCSIITLCIGGGWVSAFFVMLRDGKQGELVVLHERP